METGLAQGVPVQPGKATEGQQHRAGVPPRRRAHNAVGIKPPSLTLQTPPDCGAKEGSGQEAHPMKVRDPLGQPRLKR